MDLNTYVSLDATEMARLIQQKELSPRELVELSYQQLEKVQPILNVCTYIRKERALIEADNININNHPFAGVPMLLKDVSQALAGEPLTSGSKLLKHVISDYDSYLVRKIREAGFIITGHTTTPEFGLKNITESSLYGPTRNPWNIDYSPGGSSGGSAAAIASGIVPVAGASDGGGSIRIPASFTGLLGLKPTRGRTPVGPKVGRQWHGAAIDFVLSRTVRDSAAMLDILQIIEPAAAFQTPLFNGIYAEEMKRDFKRPLRIAYSTKSPVETFVSTDAKQAVEKTVKWLESEGHHIEEKDNGVDGVKLMENYILMNCGEISKVIMNLEQDINRSITEKDVEVETWLLNVAGRSVSAAQFSNSLSLWDIVAQQMAEFHERYDFYITPTCAHTAPEIGELTHPEERKQLCIKKFNSANQNEQQELIYDLFLPEVTTTPFSPLANLTGQPAISLPVHVSDEGLRIGVQVMANKGLDAKLLKLASHIEQSGLWIGMKGNPYFDYK